jgi:hypothetical protein
MAGVSASAVTTSTGTSMASQSGFCHLAIASRSAWSAASVVAARASITRARVAASASGETIASSRADG